MDFRNYKMNEAREAILKQSPRLGLPLYAAALGNAIVAKCWLVLTPKFRRDRACAAYGIFGEDADRRIAELDAEEKAYVEQN